MLQIAEQKDAAIRGLSNYMFMEAQRMAKVLLDALHGPGKDSLSEQARLTHCVLAGGCWRQPC